MLTITKSDRVRETRLVIACVQTKPGPQALSDVSDILRESLDWDYIFRIANRNAVLPLLSRNLLHRWNELLPDDIRATISSGHQQQVQRNMVATAKLLKLVGEFQSSNIPVLPSKAHFSRFARTAISPFEGSVIWTCSSVLLTSPARSSY